MAECKPSSLRGATLAQVSPVRAKPFTPCVTGSNATAERCVAGYRCEHDLCMPTEERIEQAAHGGSFNAMLTEARRRIAVRAGTVEA